jgi:transposase
VPRRYQSGEVDYTGSISKCGDRRMRTLLYEAANVILTRYKQPLKLKDWALAIARRSTLRKARIARYFRILQHYQGRTGRDPRMPLCCSLTQSGHQSGLTSPSELQVFSER